MIIGKIYPRELIRDTAGRELMRPSVIIGRNHQSVARQAAEDIANVIRNNPRAVLGLATGGTMEPVYAYLVRLIHEHKIDTSGLQFFNLDEYWRAPSAPYRHYMMQHFFTPIGARDDQINIPDGMAHDADEEVARYEQKIADVGGIDFQLLGVGGNGHIGFCEPGRCSLDGDTQLMELTLHTRQANAIYWNRDVNQVPRHAITMGLGTIQRAREILTIACGIKKAPVIGKFLRSRRVSSTLPISVLLRHPDMTLRLDYAAALHAGRYTNH